VKTANLDLLLDLNEGGSIGPVMTPSLGGFFTPGSSFPSNSGLILPNTTNVIDLVGPSYIEFKHKELLNKMAGKGLQVNYRYTRAPHIFSSSMVSIELQFVNTSAKEITNIQVGQKFLPAGMNINEFADISKIAPEQYLCSILGVDFNDSINAISFEICSSVGVSKISLNPSLGELIRSVQISENYFNEERKKLRGMNEHCSSIPLCKDFVDITFLRQKLFECINVAAIPTNAEGKLMFVGQTLSAKVLILITLEWKENDNLIITVNCERMVIGSMVMNELKNFLSAALKC